MDRYFFKIFEKVYINTGYIILTIDKISGFYLAQLVKILIVKY